MVVGGTILNADKKFVRWTQVFVPKVINFYPLNRNQKEVELKGNELY